MIYSNKKQAIGSIRLNRAGKTGSDIGAGDESICCRIRESDLDFYAYSNWIKIS
jgi:hypothetical protein